MPPPVWYCNFPCDVSTGAVHSYTSALSSWLGSQQVGDQIRWRPPAYKDFIQHVPAPMSMASFEKEQNTPTFASPMASNVVPERRELSAPAAGSKKDGAAERRALHRYNGALEASSTSTSSSTAAPHSSGTKRRSSAQLVAPPPTAHQHHHHSPVPQQAFSEGHASAPQASTWFYDAEALARIEFPSVSRRIDTDNITSAVAQPHPAYHAVHQGAFDGSDGGAGGAGGEPSTPQRPHASGPGDGGGASAGNSQSEVGVRPAMGMSFRNSLGGGGAFFGSSNNLVGDGSPKRDPQEGQDWYFHSAGLNSYADLLNSTRSPLTRDSFYNSSSTSGPHGSEINHHNHHDSNMLDIDIPVTIDEDDDYDDDEGSSPQQSSKTASEKSIIPMRRGSTGSMSLSGGSSPVKVGDKPVAATPTSRIPVFNRGASSYSLLAQPPFPAQVTTPAAAAAGTTAASSVVAGTSSVTSSAEFPSTTTAAPTTPISPTNPNPTTPGESPTERKKSAVFQNPARLSPAAAAVAADIDDDESVRSSISTQGVRTLGRARSKRDMYVSPYKQKRSPSMANVLASPTSPLTPTDAGASFSSTQAVVEMAPAQTEPVSLPALPIPTPAVPPAPAAAAMAATTRPPVSLIPKMSERSNLTPPRAPASTSAAPAVTPAPSALPTQQRPPSGLGQSQPLAYTTNPLHSSGGSQGGGGASAGVQNVSFAAAATSYGSAGVSNTSNGGSSSNSSMGLGGIREAGDWCSYQTWQSEERSMVQRYMRDRQIEIIVIVEGVDAATGGMVQARHSYTSDEVEWNKSFECCVFKDPADGCTTIDFSQFHELVDVPDDAPFAGVVHSSI